MKTATLFATLLLFAVSAHGQALDINLTVAVPQSEFADYVDVGGGIDAAFTFPIGQSPLHLGVDGGFLLYGREVRREPLSTTIPDVTVDVETTNNIFQGHALLRLQPQNGRIRPFAEGLVGFKYLFTETSVQDDNSDEDVFSSTNFDDWTSSYGLGAGADILLSTSVDEYGDETAIYLNIGVRYLLGGEAEYLKRGSIRRDNGQVTFDTVRSQTDMLLPRIGVRIVF